MKSNELTSPAIERRRKRYANARGRRKPSKLPAKLARTSAFSPKSRNLIKNSDFTRTYIVPQHSVIKISGRELGAQHRDALYGVLRLKPREIIVQDETKALPQHTYVYTTTWRELLVYLKREEHANNVASLVLAFEDFLKVGFTIFEGNHDWVVSELKAGRVPDTPFKGENLIRFDSNGTKLDDKVDFYLSQWALECIFKGHLVSLNADVQFALTSEYAKCYWPYIDSMNSHTWVDEEQLASLVGRSLFGEEETSRTRSEFRRSTAKAFDDMVKAGGLSEWSVETRGSGRKKTRRYHYRHALARQLDLELELEEEKTSKDYNSLLISAQGYIDAKLEAPTWDIKYLEEQWHHFLKRKKAHLPKNPDETFKNFCSSWQKNQGNAK